MEYDAGLILALLDKGAELELSIQKTWDLSQKLATNAKAYMPNAQSAYEEAKLDYPEQPRLELLSLLLEKGAPGAFDLTNDKPLLNIYAEVALAACCEEEYFDGCRKSALQALLLVLQHIKRYSLPLPPLEDSVTLAKG